MFSLEWCQGQKDLDCTWIFHGIQNRKKKKRKGNNRQLNYMYLASREQLSYIWMYSSLNNMKNIAFLFCHAHLRKDARLSLPSIHDYNVCIPELESLGMRLEQFPVFSQIWETNECETKWAAYSMSDKQFVPCVSLYVTPWIPNSSALSRALS